MKRSYARRIDAAESAQQSLSQLVTVDEIAVVGESNAVAMHSIRFAHLRVVGEEGLRLVAVRRTGSGVADVANTVVARQLGQIILVEHSGDEGKTEGSLRNQTVVLHRSHLLSIAGGDTTRICE